MASKRNVKSGKVDGSENARVIQKRLAEAIQEPRCELRHTSPWQLLIATILSAQSTDKMVNRVTPVLFARYPTPRDLAVAETEELERIVKSTGFFRMKAKAIRETSRRIAEDHGGEVPRTVEKLTALPGVARKTANVVLGTAFGISSGLTIDTHANRVSRRLGLTKESDPVRIETDLMQLFPKRAWVDLSHRLVLHGRYVCIARKPKCTQCALNEVCPAREAEAEGARSVRAKLENTMVREGFDLSGASP